MSDIKIKTSEFGDLINSLSPIIDKKSFWGESYIQLSLKEICGTGTISVIKISQLITSLNFDLTFDNDQDFILKGTTHNSFDFIYCLEGYIRQKFLNSSKPEPISFRQNAIIGRTNSTGNVINIPGGVPVKVSVIIFNNETHLSIVEENNTMDLRRTAIKELSNCFENGNFSYLGSISFKPATYANTIMKTDISSHDMLYTEAAILNVMAAQWEKYQEDAESVNVDAPLRPSELDKVAAMESFIISNIAENLTIDRLVRVSGLNPAKLQIGFNYLFNTTISSYVREKRLDKAAQLIRETDYNVSELVYSIGFSSRSYFSKIFKQRFGVLPSQCVSNPDLLMAV